MRSKKQNTKKSFSIIALLIVLIAAGCVAPLLIIHYENSYPHWQPFILEACGLGGLALIFGGLLAEKLH